ncbi:hypothetical protein V6Z12_D07G162200 [Gossypium hirsutum]
MKLKVLSWNCRGLGNFRAPPGVVFLSETKLNTSELEKVKRQCNMESFFIVAIDGRKEGLAMLWKSKFDLNLTSFSLNHIVMEVKDGMDDFFFLTSIFGESETHVGSSSWNLTRSLARESRLPWLCFGDFNVITDVDEKWDKLERSEKQMEAFCEALEDSGLYVIGLRSVIHLDQQPERG